MTLKKIRIVRDSYSGYEVQVWRLWFPFWVQLGGTNTSSSVEDAREYASSFNQKTILESRFVENVSKLTLKDLFDPPMTDEQRKNFEEFLKEREAESIL